MRSFFSILSNSKPFLKNFCDIFFKLIKMKPIIQISSMNIVELRMFRPLMSLKNWSDTSEEIWFLMVWERRWSRKSLSSFKSDSLFELAFLNRASYWDNLKLLSWVRSSKFFFTYLLFAFFLFSLFLLFFFIFQNSEFSLVIKKISMFYFFFLSLFFFFWKIKKV